MKILIMLAEDNDIPLLKNLPTPDLNQYEFKLISDDKSLDDREIQSGIFYIRLLEDAPDMFEYVVQTPDGPTAIGSITNDDMVEFTDRNLTMDYLLQVKHKILRITSRRGHTRLDSSQWGVVNLILTGRDPKEKRGIALSQLLVLIDFLEGYYIDSLEIQNLMFLENDHPELLSSCESTLVEALNKQIYLYSLCIKGCGFGEEEVNRAYYFNKFLKNNVFLKEYQIENCNLDNQAIITLGKSLRRNNHLLYLSIKNNQISGGEVIEHLMEICSAHETLESLNVSGNTLFYLPSLKVEKIELTKEQQQTVNQKNISHVVTLLKANKIKVLNLENTFCPYYFVNTQRHTVNHKQIVFSNDLIKQLNEGLGSNTSLTALHLSNMSQQGAEILQSAIKLHFNLKGLIFHPSPLLSQKWFNIYIMPFMERNYSLVRVYPNIIKNLSTIEKSVQLYNKKMEIRESIQTLPSLKETEIESIYKRVQFLAQITKEEMVDAFANPTVHLDKIILKNTFNSLMSILEYQWFEKYPVVQLYNQFFAFLPLFYNHPERKVLSWFIKIFTEHKFQGLRRNARYFFAEALRLLTPSEEDVTPFFTPLENIKCQLFFLCYSNLIIDTSALKRLRQFYINDFVKYSLLKKELFSSSIFLRDLFNLLFKLNLSEKKESNKPQENNENTAEPPQKKQRANHETIYTLAKLKEGEDMQNKTFIFESLLLNEPLYIHPNMPSNGCNCEKLTLDYQNLLSQVKLEEKRLLTSLKIFLKSNKYGFFSPKVENESGHLQGNKLEDGMSFT